MSLNRWEGIGHLGADPELRHIEKNGEHLAVCQFSIACTRKWRPNKGSDETKEETHWQRCVLFGKAAETFAEHKKKGHQVHVAGRLVTSRYEDKEGITRYPTDCIVQEFTFCGLPTGGRPNAAELATQNDNYIPADPGDDDIPY